MIPIVPTDSASIYAKLNTLQYREARLALIRPNNPPPGIAGYLMDIVDEDTVDLESDITDYYIEDNTAIQDQIALRPEIITVRGMVAEIVQFQQPLTPTVGNAPQNRLPAIPSLQPELTSYWANKQRETSAALLVNQQQTANSNSLYKEYDQKFPVDKEAQTNQSRIFNYFYQLWKGRQYFSVETPWGFFNSMAIQSLSFTQGSTTRYASEISVTFKKLHFAESVDLVSTQSADRSAKQKSPVMQNSNVAVRPLTFAESQAVMREINPPISP